MLQALCLTSGVGFCGVGLRLPGVTGVTGTGGGSYACMRHFEEIKWSSDGVKCQAMRETLETSPADMEPTTL